MRKWFHPGMLLVATLFAASASLPFITTAKDDSNFYVFEVNLRSDRVAITQLFYDVGHGFNEQDSSSRIIKVSATPVTYRLPLPSGTLRALRFDPTDREGTMTIAHARIVDGSGHIIRQFKAGDFSAVQQLPKFAVEGDTVHMTTVSRANDPVTYVALDRPIALPFGWRNLVRSLLPVWIIAGCVTLLVGVVFSLSWPKGVLSSAIDRARLHPLATLASIAAIAVVIQCHPVIFCGKSFVSPDNAAYLLYDRFPTLPGYETTGLEDSKGADVGAMLYQHLYYPVIEREALFHYGEFPFWNRYSLCGVPLFGQGQSMFGEVLNLLPMAARSAAWSWDLKFLLTRWLYAFGIGLAVYLLTGHLTSSVILAFAAPYIGFFAYRINHPAQFSLCFSIWILVAWLLVCRARGWKALGWSLGLLVFANWEVLTSGTVKEAYMLVLGMNSAGFLVLLFADMPWRQRLLKSAAGLVAGTIFILLTAPIWMIFLDTLKMSQTSYDAPGAIQVDPSLVIGFFEDLFYRQLKPNEAQAEPSANVIVFLGIIWAFVRAPETFRQRGFLAIGLASLLPLALVFGVVPDTLIFKIPFIANIHHIDNTFSCILVVLSTVLAGFGLKALRERAGQPGWGIDCALAVLFALAPVGLYFGATRTIAKSVFFNGYASSLGLALVAAIIGLTVWARSRRIEVLTLSVAGALVLLLWRHGEYVRTPFDPYVFNPKVRSDFHVSSSAIEAINKTLGEPSRPTGLAYNLFSGFHQMLGWEGINGVDAVRNGNYDELAIAGEAKKIRWWSTGELRESDIEEAQPVQDVFNVRYYLATHADQRHKIQGLRRLGSFDLDIYESPTAWPRAFFTDRITTYASLPQFMQQIRTGDRRPFAAIATEEKESIALPLSRPDDTGNARMRPASNYRFTTNTTSFTVAAPGPGIVVLTESYYPKDFRATLNGNQVPYFRVNHAFKAIRIPAAGTYDVTFTYRPHHLTRSLILSAVGFILLSAGIAALAYCESKFGARTFKPTEGPIPFMKPIINPCTLSVIVPVYNERATVREALDALMAKQIPGVRIEILLIESNSTDGSRAIVLSYKDNPRVKIILEDKPRGKGHAVRAGLAQATGDIIMIQDADLEYDLADYDILVAPIIAGRQEFVLGSRHGQGGWAIRKFSDQPIRAIVLNLAHWTFTLLINASLGVWLSDPFTMYKVFRRDCLEGLTFTCNRFDFDWELLIKLVRKGHRPVEIPISYSSRSFKEGKKIRMFRDPATWIVAWVKSRFGPLN